MSDDLVNFGSRGYRNNVRKFARITGVTGEAVMWDGGNGAVGRPSYDAWFKTEQTVECFSASANDTIGGSGTYIVEVTGQGEDGLEKTDTVQIDGATPVEFTEKFVIIYRARTINPNAWNDGNNLPIDGANDGAITIRSKAEPTKIMAYIQANKGQTQMAIWRCPANKYAEFVKLGVYPQSGNQGSVAKLMARNSIDESWLNVGELDEDGFLTEPEWPEGNREYISPGTDLCLVVNSTQSGNFSSLLWVKMFDIENYEELLAEESE